VAGAAVPGSVARQEEILLGRKVAIIGGGNAASIRRARLCAWSEALIVYRRERKTCRYRRGTLAAEDEAPKSCSWRRRTASSGRPTGT